MIKYHVISSNYNVACKLLYTWTRGFEFNFRKVLTWERRYQG